MNNNIKFFTDYTIELIKAALTDKNTPLPPENFSWELLYLFAVRHKLVSLIYFALIKLPKEVQENIPNFSDFVKIWKQELFLDANRQAEAISVSGALGDNGIDHVFLKGYVTKHLYPDTVMRSMGDMDILYRTHLYETDCSNTTNYADTILNNELLKNIISTPKNIPDSTDSTASSTNITSIMSSLGYQQINHTPKDDTFFNPLNNTYIELHRTLVDKGYQKEFLYLENIWHRLIKKSDHEYVMSNEDFYIYHIIHMAKHVQHSGIGILPFVDLWLYVNSIDLDRDYLDKEFTSLQLSSFETYARQLAFKWFSDNSSSATDEDNVILNLFSDYIFRSGSYGTETQMEINTIAGSSTPTGSGALLRRIFPNKTTMVNYYGAVIEKHPYLIPFYWIHLNVKRLFSKNISYKKKKHIISNISENQIDSTKKLMDSLFDS